MAGTPRDPNDPSDEGPAISCLGCGQIGAPSTIHGPSGQYLCAERCVPALRRAHAGSRHYGGNGTIHQTGEVDVEVDGTGEVVSVWFRCQALPFRQSRADAGRAADMRRMYASPAGRLAGVEIVDS